MKRTMLYVALAFTLGLAMIVIPTWFLIAGADQNGKPDVNFAWQIPLLEYPERDYIDAVSSRELEFLSISFFIALAVYVLFRRKTPRSDFAWPYFRQ